MIGTKVYFILFNVLTTISISHTIPDCPLGFYLFEFGAKLFCVQIKPDETYFNKYDECAGNIVPLDFSSVFAFNASSLKNDLFWTDFIRAYEGGPFVNWIIGDDLVGQPITQDLSWENVTANEDDMCAVVSISKKTLRAVDCNEKFQRLCVVDALNDRDENSTYDCPSSYIQFSAPIPTCLYLHNATLRATWQQANNFCSKKSSYLLHRGYIYSNSSYFLQNPKTRELPLGIKRSGNDFLWTNYTNVEEKIPLSQWNFHSNEDFNASKPHIFLSDGKWRLSEKQHIYLNVMCEYFVEQRTLNITIEEKDSQLFVLINDFADGEDIQCFTDAAFYFPIKVPHKYREKWSEFKIFGIDGVGNGYYWCAVNNTKEFISSSSNKFLYIHDKKALDNTYALLIHYDNLPVITTSFIEAMKKDLEVFFDDKTLKNNDIRIKRVYDNNQVLLHLNSKMEDPIDYRKKISSVRKNSFDILYMRKIEECDTKESEDIYHETTTEFFLKKYKFGDYISEDECVGYICTGDFNHGMFWASRKNYSGECIDTTESTPSTVPLVTLSPEEAVDDVSNYTSMLAHSNVTSVSTETLQQVTTKLNNILNIDSGNIVPQSVIRDLELIVGKVMLKENETEHKIVQPNIAIIIANRNAPLPVVGIKVYSVGAAGLSTSSVETMTSDAMSTNMMTNLTKTDLIVNVSQSTSNNASSMLSFVVFKDDGVFNQNVSKEQQRVNSRILSVSITNTTNFENEEHVYIYFKPFESAVSANESKLCAYWDFAAGADGNWSTEGCELLPNQTIDGFDTCRCNHLTHFSEIIRYNGEVSEVDKVILKYISLVGCVASITGVIVILLTGVLFKSWRRDFSNKIWMHLSGAIGIVYLSFLIILLVVDESEKDTMACLTLGIILHYSILASFCWMLISAVLSYQRLVTVFVRNTSHRLLKACIFGWIIPALPVIILASIDLDNYGGNYSFCFPNNLGFWLTVFLPILLVVLANISLFFVIIHSIFSSKIKRHGDNNIIFRSMTVAFLLFYLFGLTWIFGFFGEYLVMNYLFCITATLQGLVLCIFFVLGNKKTRDLWCTRLRLRTVKKLPLTVSMSRSTTGKTTSNSKNKSSVHLNDYKANEKPLAISKYTEKDDSRFS